MKKYTQNKQGLAYIAEPWTSIKPACQHLGISIPTMRRWIRDERVEPKRTPSGQYRFRISELNSLLD